MKAKARKEAIAAVVACLLLAATGAALLYKAAVTPWHVDGEAYFETLNSIRAEVYGRSHDLEPGISDPAQQTISFAEASARFHDLQEEHRTPKWLYADLGYAAVAWGGLAAAWLVVRRSRILAEAPRWRMAWAIGLASLTLSVAGVAAIGHVLGRQQVPEWADSAGIALGGVPVIALLAVIVLAVFAAPVWNRREPIRGQFVWPRPHWRSALITIVYLPLAMLGALCVALFWQAGGWALSVAGFLIGWIALESRAAALTPKRKVSRNPVPNLSDR